MSDAEGAHENEVGLQFSLYPLRQSHVRPAIKAAVRAAEGEGLAVTVGSLSTFAAGDEQTVLAAVRAAFRAACAHGPTVMVVTLSSGLPSPEAVSDVQSGSGA